MAEKNVWFITGAGRGMGTDIARAALGAGHSVVATGRDAARAAAAVGEHENLLTVALDVTDVAAAEAAVSAAVERFGRIDVLVNNAGNFYAGYFETLSAEQFRAQMETNFFGPLNLTRAVLPVRRGQRRGQIIAITSTAGFVGGQFTSAYAASKIRARGLDGVVERRDRPLRDLDDDRRAGLLPHRAAGRGLLDDLGGAPT
jgi:NAD(P)-dependent dehydrogenase (short-subunit alcohol dehydrogenase family)